MPIDVQDIICFLTEEGRLDPDLPVAVIPLTGGVSSDIHLIDNGPNKYVLKEAREQLKTHDTWIADVSRNFAEQAFIEYLSSFRPDAVPAIIYRDLHQPYFIMEYLGPPLINWKTKLLSPAFEVEDAFRVADLLVDIHRHSAADMRVPELFDYAENFYSLRIEPYLITTGDRHPGLKEQFYSEAERLQTCRQTLVHGDYSPKNLLVSPGRIVLLDHEVANYGDPAFDLAFLMTHMVLKRIHLKDRIPPHPDPALTIWKQYFDHFDLDESQSMQERTSRLTLMLLLARVDGKSPVEYLTLKDQQLIRDFVTTTLPDAVSIDFYAYYQNLLSWPIK